MSQALGKGLSALIAESASAADEISRKPKEGSSPAGAIELPLSQLVPGKYQPRSHFDSEPLHELADSIREQGVIQPIIVRNIGENQYEIIAGERRWRASKEVGLDTIPAIIKANISDLKALEIALIENIQRQDLNPVEEAEGYRRLQKEFNYTQEQLANVLGKSRSHVTNLLRLLQLPEKVLAYVNDGALSMGHARALVSADNAEQIAHDIVKNKLSVRETEKRVNAAKSKPNSGSADTQAQKPKKKASRPAPRAEDDTDKDEDLVALERALSSSLGMKVYIDDYADGGTVTVHFSNLSELDVVLQRLGG